MRLQCAHTRTKLSAHTGVRNRRSGRQGNNDRGRGSNRSVRPRTTGIGRCSSRAYRSSHEPELAKPLRQNPWGGRPVCARGGARWPCDTGARESLVQLTFQIRVEAGWLIRWRMCVCVGASTPVLTADFQADPLRPRAGLKLAWVSVAS